MQRKRGPFRQQSSSTKQLDIYSTFSLSEKLHLQEIAAINSTLTVLTLDILICHFGSESSTSQVSSQLGLPFRMHGHIAFQ